MAEQKTCPECNGKKIVPGTCSCDAEWQGTNVGEDAFDPCQCSPDVTCPTCEGKGYLEA
jgi:hypothetical protein